MSTSTSSKARFKEQLSLKQLFDVIRRSKLPWFWIAVTFIINLFYNRVLYSLPISTGRLLEGDLSTQALMEALGSYGLYAVVVVIQAIILAYTDAVTTRNARRCLWGQMLRIKESYYDTIDSSEMISAVTIDLSYGMTRLVSLLCTVIPDIIFLVKAAITITGYDVSLLLTMLAFLPLKYLYMLILGRKFYDTQSEIQDRIGSLTATLGERMDNLPLVKAFNREEDEFQKGKKDIEQLYKTNVRFASLSGISTAVENALIIAQQFACMVVAVILMQKGRITMSQWVTFFLFYNNISTKFTALVGDWLSMKVVTGSLARTHALQTAPREDMKEQGTAGQDLSDYTLQFDGVSFAYLPEEKALDNVSFTIPQGQKVAIVGTCGSGKSTALSLMERFYEPLSGQVTLGGVDVSDIRMDDYRHALAYVPQMTQVFSSTVRDALTYGNPRSFSDEELLKAAQRTGLDQYLALCPDGLDSQLQNGGDCLSGGQMQKLIITRELLKDSRIVLFDEPTSALDAQSSRMVKRMMMDDFEDKTVVVVTHDLSLVDEMDAILLLHDGILLDSGNYNELMQRSEPFRRMVESQQRKEALA